MTRRLPGQRSLWLFIFVLTQLFLVRVAHAQSHETRRAHLEQIVTARLKFYAERYPDISFAILDTAGDVSRNMQALARIIGEDPVPLGYEHPLDLRQKLLIVTLMRIEILFQNNIESATLFKPGKNALATRKQVCVITLNPWTIAADDRTATRHLLEFPDDEFAAVATRNYLEHESHLKFVLDHEIYHCLDAAYNGPIPMSQLAHWDGYYNFKDELGADAFGVLMNIAEHGSLTAYSRKLRNIRRLALLCCDSSHYTYQAIDAVLKMAPAQLAQKNVRERFRIASRLRDRLAGSYEDYLRYANAAYHAMIQLGSELETGLFTDTEPDAELVKALVKSTKAAYRDLTGHEMPAL
ncbi:MAG: hypothetical protein GC149_07705 [Gammaproteobacteria bacterium]|nr:hypothetical protein [Gammaproteobacteria bacterium]